MIIENKKEFAKYKNKLVAIALITIGLLVMFLVGDATFLVFAMIIGIPLFFAKKNYIS